MKKTTLILMSVILAGVTFGQAPAPTQVVTEPTAQQYVLVPAPKAVAPSPTVPPVEPAVANRAAQKVTNQFTEVGSAIGSGLTGLVESIGGATGRTVDKTTDVTGKVVDKTGQVVGSVMDRTFGKDVTLVQGIDNVSKTEAGRFTMLVIAWKVMGKDALDLLRRFTGVAIGVPIEIGLIVIAIWITRRFWMVRSVVTKSEGPFWSKTKTYEVVNQRIDDDTRYAGLFLTWLAMTILSVLNISFVIL